MAISESTTRLKIMEAAMRLFWERGYERCSIGDLVAAAGVRSGSLYHFFARKEDVLIAVLETYLASLTPHVMAPAFARERDPIERVFAVLADYRERLVSTGFTYRCPIGSLALEMGNVSETARTLINQNFAAWRVAIESCFEAAAPRFRKDVDRKALAALVLTVMEGGVMQAAAERSAVPFDASIAQLRSYIYSLLKK
jgi:TetR/AcrR family transcriptional repressor of nem operon